MVNLVWRSFYEIGVDFIDEDHRQLMTIMDDVVNAAAHNDHKECGKLLDKFIARAREHFDKEEEYLSNAHYPGLDEHREFHQQLINYADLTKSTCQDLESGNDLKDCIDNMAKLIFDDIFRGDIKFKSYLQYNGYID
ncbi:MAG: hypothetical protein BMS9Abin26_1561 [Gammaproteobacteria bacterium]|nr:MAG: hypothetical protein BMS9Abin26_1561 [Gammaproteobacteria bacterium]